MEGSDPVLDQQGDVVGSDNSLQNATGQTVQYNFNGDGENEAEGGELKWGCMLPLVIALVDLWMLYGIEVYLRSDSWEARDGFGGMFGGFEALVSAFAFAGLIYTAYLQRRELALQRLDLRETRQEIKGQREQLEKQSEILDLQQFESTFFNLVTLHNQIVESMSFSEDKGDGEVGVTVSGRQTLVYIREELLEPKFQIEQADPKGREPYEIALLTYQYIEEQGAADILGHYFRNLYHIIKFVDEEAPSDPKRYVNFLRAQLSGTELVLLFFNCLEPGFETFRDLVVRYALFEHLPPWKFTREVLALYRDVAVYGDNRRILALLQEE